MIVLSASGFYFYVLLYRFDKEKKGSLLDLRPLGQQKNYIDFSRQKLHSVQLNSENKALIMSPLLGQNVQAPYTSMNNRDYIPSFQRRLNNDRDFANVDSQALRIPKRQVVSKYDFKLGLQPTVIIEEQSAHKEDGCGIGSSGKSNIKNFSETELKMLV